jgi:hypothetical protein
LIIYNELRQRVSEQRGDFGIISRLEWAEIQTKWRESCSRITAGDRPMRSVAKLTEIEAGLWKGGLALNGLLKFIDEHQREGRGHKGGFESFEHEVSKRFRKEQRLFIREELESLDRTLPKIVIEGKRHRRVVSGHGKYMTPAGLV